LRTLLLDIETAPNLAWVWGLWKQDIPLAMLVESGYMLCFAAKWLHEPDTEFYSLRNPGKTGMVRAAWDLLDEADTVVHYNGKQFDIPTLNGEMLLEGLPPPSPFKQIDLCRVAKKQFRLPSNKLQYVSDNLLSLGGKEKHRGFDMWLGVMTDDDQSWADMERYNRRDVTVLEDVYDRLLPWIPGHPNVNLYTTDTDGCPKCGSAELTKEGRAYTALGTYQRYSCRGCGGWSRGNRRLEGVEKVGL